MDRFSEYIPNFRHELSRVNVLKLLSPQAYDLTTFLINCGCGHCYFSLFLTKHTAKLSLEDRF